MNEETKAKLRDTLRKLFALMGSDNEAKISALLKKYNLTWNDAMEIIGATADGNADASLLFDLLMRGRRKQADILIELAAEADKFRTADGRVWADICIKEHRETWPVRNAGFKRWLRHCFFVKEKTAPSAEAVETCICHLEAAAHCEGAPVREVFIRVAGLDDRIFLDLCDEDWSVIEVDASGWRAVKGSPVRFHRTPGMLPLPFPTTGGALSELRSLLNVSADDDDDFVILVGSLLAAIRGRPPFPVLALAGPPGASKSTALCFLRDLIDPHQIEPGALPNEVRDLAIASSKRFVLAFDNLSGIPVPISDMLCRLSTGGGFAIRALYSDDDEIVFSYTRPVMLAGIDDVAGRHDLADRTASLSLEHISEPSKKMLSELRAAFTRTRPRILGRLLDIAAHGLRNLPSTHLKRLPRMADHARWVAACETAEWEAGTFERASAANKQALAAASLEADEVAIIIADLVGEGSGWEGIAKDLLTLVNNRASDQQKRGKHWPRTPHAMASRLRRANEILRAHGWAVSFTRSGKNRAIHIVPISPDKPPTTSSPSSHRHKPSENNGLGGDDSRDDRNPVPAAIVTNGGAAGGHPPASPSSPPSSPVNPLKYNENDDGDDSDDVIPALSGSKCAYCGESHPPPQTWSWSGEAVALHPDCEEYWLREREAGDSPQPDDGDVLP